MTKKPLRHRVEHTKNKHSRAVFRGDTIVIRLAKGLSKAEEEEHISDLLERMTQHAMDEQKKTLLDPFGKLLDSGESATITLASGQKYQFVLQPGTRTRVARTARGWNITIGPRTRRSGLHKLLWKTLAAAEQPVIESLIYGINNETYGVGIQDVKLCFASSQWGSCSPKGTIMLNAALLFVDPEVLRYVIVHELAHRKRADHSPKYWEWVQWAMPGYKRARKKLGAYRLPTL